MSSHALTPIHTHTPSQSPVPEASLRNVTIRFKEEIVCISLQRTEGGVRPTLIIHTSSDTDMTRRKNTRNVPHDYIG